MELSEFIRPSIVIVDYNLPMRECVQLMIDKNISSVLVIDNKDNIVGIITERDIVRKLTLSDVTDKLDRTAGTVMTREVKFVRRDHLIEDVLKLHLELKVRHFPILTGDQPKEENVAGMLSVTDLLKFFINKDKKRKSEAAVKDTPVLDIAIFSANKTIVADYTAIFSQLRFKVQEVEDFGKYVQEKKTLPLIFDLDSFSGVKRSNLIPAVLKYAGHLLVTTSDGQALNAFRKYLKKDQQAAAIKPLDFTYINWLVREHWLGK